MAMTPTKDSISMLPYPTMRAWLSFVMSLGVVPEAISEWKPEMAPQAMVMKQNGKTLPAKIGPVPSVKRVKGGRSICGWAASIPSARAAMVPNLMNVLR